MPPSPTAKKRKSTDQTGGRSKPATDAAATLHTDIGYQPLGLVDIQARIEALCRRVPVVPENGFLMDTEKAQEDATATTDPTTTTPTTPQNTSTVPVAKTPCRYDKAAILTWASAVQSVLEEFNLLIATVSAATYRWGTDRSGAADQNLNVLSSELVRSQEQIMGRVTPRLNDVIAPVVSLLTDKTVTTTVKKKISSTNGAATDDDDDLIQVTETKQNYFITTHEDPDYVNLCHTILARNVHTLRQVVLANFDKALRAVTDYLTACAKDNQHDSRGFVY